MGVQHRKNWASNTFGGQLEFFIITESHYFSESFKWKYGKTSKYHDSVTLCRNLNGGYYLLTNTEPGLRSNPWLQILILISHSVQGYPSLRHQELKIYSYEYFMTAVIYVLQINKNLYIAVPNIEISQYLIWITCIIIIVAKLSDCIYSLKTV